MPLILGSHILEREKVFEDPEMRKFWDRLIHMTTPDGAVVPFGPSWGWNSHAGERMAFLEIVAAHTGGGRYRFTAHRIFDQLRAIRTVSPTETPLLTLRSGTARNLQRNRPDARESCLLTVDRYLHVKILRRSLPEQLNDGRTEHGSLRLLSRMRSSRSSD
jgi:hypothetical protein